MTGFQQNFSVCGIQKPPAPYYQRSHSVKKINDSVPKNVYFASNFFQLSFKKTDYIFLV